MNKYKKTFNMLFIIANIHFNQIYEIQVNLIVRLNWVWFFLSLIRGFSRCMSKEKNIRIYDRKEVQYQCNVFILVDR